VVSCLIEGILKVKWCVKSDSWYVTLLEFYNQVSYMSMVLQVFFFNRIKSAEKQSLIVQVVCCHQKCSLEVKKHETKKVMISFMFVPVSRYIFHSSQPQQGSAFQFCLCGQVKKGIHRAFHLASACPENKKRDTNNQLPIASDAFGFAP